MTDRDTPFRSVVLSRAKKSDDYATYRAALEWDLLDPIVIESRSDLKSEEKWHRLVEPYQHQVSNLITYCRRLPVTLLADDVGLGKTISAGLIVSELVARGRLSKFLVVCPKILGPQWQEELLSKFEIPSEIAIGADLVHADPKDGGAVITTYHSARAHLESVPKDRFQMLILDEAHKLRNLYGVDPPPQVAKKFRKALKERRFQFVLMLTATPLQNRLWDLYSLVDLLTVARGHQNPFGSEGVFARKFIADGREQARQLKPEARDEFRSIVYSYMSRVRRGDANLSFPDRKVQMHRVDPTSAELQLIELIAKPIQKLNRLAQISILQALASSPDALAAQLKTMARNSTIPQELAEKVEEIVRRMPLSAKLTGLAELVRQLRSQNASSWRVVIFTCRRETQTTIEQFLSGLGIKVGIINGSTGQRNQETIARFRMNPPQIHAIVSTESGSEGVNLQAANVVVNFDLPWNPMIVEQRIGRVQRLASVHAHVTIFNISLRNTFEDYIVARLSEKLQLASHAIGDIEALLEASGMDEDDDASFEEQIRKLVVASLAGQDVQKAMKQAEESIHQAKATLETERANINSMLGAADGAGFVGPKAPSIAPLVRAKSAREMTLAAFEMLGATVELESGVNFVANEKGALERIRFTKEPDALGSSNYYGEGSPALLRLIGRVTASALHEVEDVDSSPADSASSIAEEWVRSFGGEFKSASPAKVTAHFRGTALVRAKASVAHDSLERLVEVKCDGTRQADFEPLPNLLMDASSVGVDQAAIANAIRRDEGISEFSRFYLERRAQEVAAAQDNERKRKKLEEDFTPRLQLAIVGLKGRYLRRAVVNIAFQILGGAYRSSIEVEPSRRLVCEAPQLCQCSETGRMVPRNCLESCSVSGQLALRHLLVISETSQRYGLRSNSRKCELSGRTILLDEGELSAVTGRFVQRDLLKQSALSSKKAEPDCFAACEFTGSNFLLDELCVSDFSGKKFRIDQAATSEISGRRGHSSEFVQCASTGARLSPSESEVCEVSGKIVRPGLLRACELTGKRVLPEELKICSSSGKIVLNSMLVQSSLSGASVIREIAIRSERANYCLPSEAKRCAWGGRERHPEDLRKCSLTGVEVGLEYVVDDPPILQPLVNLLEGSTHAQEGAEYWTPALAIASRLLDSKTLRVESACRSPTGDTIALAIEQKSLFGLKRRHAGLIYSVGRKDIVGRLCLGRREAAGWRPDA